LQRSFFLVSAFLGATDVPVASRARRSALNRYSGDLASADHWTSCAHGQPRPQAAAASLAARSAESWGMSVLTRRRNPDARQESWQVYYGDLRVGTIAIRSGNLFATDPWGWRCGFLSGQPSKRLHVRHRGQLRPGARRLRGSLAHGGSSRWSCGTRTSSVDRGSITGGMSRAFGRALVLGMPSFLTFLGAAGTAAMIWVGGGIVVHGLEAYGAHFVGATINCHSPQDPQNGQLWQPCRVVLDCYSARCQSR
jgi:hypothetical protein